MTAALPPVIPGLVSDIPGSVARTPRRAASSVSGPPLVSLIGHRPRTARYSLRPVDTHGYVTDQGIVGFLGWQPDDQLGWRLTDGVAALSPCKGGAAAITRRGHLRLPAKLRHTMGAEIGDRVLLVAPHTKGLLFVLPLALLDQLVATRLAAISGGDVS